MEPHQGSRVPVKTQRDFSSLQESIRRACMGSIDATRIDGMHDAKKPVRAIEMQTTESTRGSRSQHQFGTWLAGRYITGDISNWVAECRILFKSLRIDSKVGHCHTSRLRSSICVTLPNSRRPICSACPLVLPPSIKSAIFSSRCSRIDAESSS